MRITLRSTLIILVVALCVPAAASASLFCVNVNATACPMGTDEGADLQHALNDAATIGGATNTVNIGPGTFTPISPNTEFTYPSSSHVLILSGTGITGTTLQGVASSPHVLTVHAPAPTVATDPPPSSMSGITIKAVGTASGGAVLENMAVTNLAVTLPASSTGTGLSLLASTLTDGSVTAATPLSNASRGIQSDGQTSLVRVTTSAQRGVTASSGTLDARNLRITSTGFGLVAESGAAVTVNEALLTMPTGTPAGNTALLSQGAGTILNGRSMTVIGAGTGPTGVKVNGIAGTAAATISDSIFSGFTNDISRTTDGAGGSFANVTLDHDIANPSDPTPLIPGTATFTADINADPKFVDKARGDYRPRFDSPAIDSGNPCSGVCASTPDMATPAVTRPRDGNGDGSAILDRGAFEYVRSAPSVNAVAGETARFIGGASSFTAAGSDPDADPLTYAWRFDDGATGSGAVVSHLFTTLGRHTATVTATDPTGLTATATATTTIVTPPPPSTPGGGTPGGGGIPDTTAPSLTKLTLTHPTFSVSTAVTALVAKAKAKARKLPKGTTIRFTLSETATVALKLELETAGVTVSGKCVAKSKKHSHGTKCTLYTSKGTLTRRSLAAGADSVAFSGRIASKPLLKGSYRLSATATDAAGNHSKTAHAELKIA